MALDRTNLVALMKQVAKANPSAPVAYSFGDQQLSYEALNETLYIEKIKILFFQLLKKLFQISFLKRLKKDMNSLQK